MLALYNTHPNLTITLTTPFIIVDRFRQAVRPKADMIPTHTVQLQPCAGFSILLPGHVTWTAGLWLTPANSIRYFRRIPFPPQFGVITVFGFAYSCYSILLNQSFVAQHHPMHICFA